MLVGTVFQLAIDFIQGMQEMETKKSTMHNKHLTNYGQKKVWKPSTTIFQQLFMGADNRYFSMSSLSKPRNLCIIVQILNK